MKRSFLNILISSLLLCNLLCTQVVIHFFHYHEEELSGSVKKTTGSDFSIKKAVTKCKVCSLHIIHDLFYNKETFFEFINPSEQLNYVLKISSYYQTLLFVKGRGPPVLSSLS